jgi:anti-sigma-K factor RskA
LVGAHRRGRASERNSLPSIGFDGTASNSTFPPGTSRFSARRDLLWSWALWRRLTVVAVAATAVVIALNLALIVLTV